MSYVPLSAVLGKGRPCKSRKVTYVQRMKEVTCIQYCICKSRGQRRTLFCTSREWKVRYASGVQVGEKALQVLGKKGVFLWGWV